ncbi:MAG: hypothetical protein LBQ15_02230 [Clostridium sp.]|jgi:HlyD family secretion protein|nr:hypothetical protein [Clostridium sp.]
MRGIEIKWDEVSDSKEYYSSRPKPLMSLFIYFILLMIVLAVVYSFIGKIEIVSTGNGSIRPNSKISTVSNLVAGKISELSYQDGQFMKAGEILMVLEHTYDLQIGAIDKEINKLRLEIEMLTKYLESIKVQENKFSDDIHHIEYEYYVRFAALQNNAKATAHDHIAESKRLNMSADGLEASINDLRNDVEMLILLQQSIEQGTDLLKDNPKYQNIYRQYLLDLDMLKHNYDQTMHDIEENNSIHELGSTLKNLESNLEDYSTLSKSIENGQNYFSPDHPFVSNYNEYEALYKQYFLAVQRAENSYEDWIQNQIDGSDWQIEDARLQVVIAQEVLHAFVSKTKAQIATAISSLEEQIAAAKLELNRANLISEKQKKANEAYALSMEELLLDNKVNVESELTAKRQELKSLENTLRSTHITLELIQMNTLENGDSLAFSSLWLNALIDSYTALSAKESELDSLKLQRLGLQEQADLHTITAQIDGVIRT